MNFEQFGWKADGTAFLIGDRLYENGVARTTAISPELRARAQWLYPKIGGNAQAWKEAVDNLMGRGSEGMSFTILASFASVLMRFLEENEGGAIINLMTRHSGAGKTTVLKCASSVWAANERALSLTTIDTKVSKSITLADLCNLPAFYDEFSSKDPQVIRDFAVMFTSGRDKTRATNDGGDVHIQFSASAWQMLLISASNQSLIETILSDGQSIAPAMRVMELPVESSGQLTQSELLAISRQLADNAGWAGHEFLLYVTRPEVLAWIRKALPRAIDEVMAKTGFPKEYRYWARTLSAVACAATIVEKLGLISFSSARIMAWAMQHFTEAAKVAPEHKGSMLHHLATYLGEHLDETLVMPGPAQGRRQIPPLSDIPKKAINIRVEDDTDTCYVGEKHLRTWLEKRCGGGYGTLITELKNANMLIAETKPLTLGAGSGMRTGQIPCLGFDVGKPVFSGVAALTVIGDDHRGKLMEKFGIIKNAR